MRGLFSGSAILAAAVAVGMIAPPQAMAIDSLFEPEGSMFLPPAAVEHGLQIAQTETPQEPAAEAAAAAAGEDENPVDERATDALVDMGEALRNLHTFAVRMDATLEQVMDNGQKIEFGGTAFYRVSRPDRLRLDILTDTGGKELYYDGTTLTVFTPGRNFFGRAEAKPTIRETIEWMEDTYGIEAPLADLFDWGTERAPFEELEIALPVGSARINGVRCGHYAFRTEETDWEVWIELGDRALPLKFAVTDRTQDALPRFEALLTWSTFERFDDRIFSFDPPDSASEIPLKPLSDWAKLVKQE